MLKQFTFLFVFAGVLCGLSAVCAQEATEIYIPIGKSPGVSGKASVIGKIEAVNAQARTLKVNAGAASHVAKLASDTRIWLDRTQVKKPNTAGSMQNCQAGLRCEVKYKYRGAQRLEEVEWIKIEVMGY